MHYITGLQSDKIHLLPLNPLFRWQSIISNPTDSCTMYSSVGSMDAAAKKSLLLSTVTTPKQARQVLIVFKKIKFA